MLRPVLFSVVGGLRGSGERGPRLGDVGGILWVLFRVRHNGPLRLVHIRWVSVACAGQVDAFPVGVPDRQALFKCIAQSRFVRLYEGVLFGKVGSPEVIVVDGWFRSRWFDALRRVLWREEVIQGTLYGPPPCGWPVQDLCCVCTVVRRRCSAGGPLQSAGHACAASGGAGRSRMFMRVCSWFWLAVAQGPGAFPTRRTRALRRALRISCCSCSPSASARIWWITKKGHRFGAVGVSAIRSRWGMAPGCCSPSRWNLHVADYTPVCSQRRRAHCQRQ